MRALALLFLGLIFLVSTFSSPCLAKRRLIVAELDVSEQNLVHVNPGFLGFSLELQWIKSMLSKSSFLQLALNLKTLTGVAPNLRIGGNSADESWWNPQRAHKPTNITHSITETDLEALRRAAVVTGDQIVFGLSFLHPNDSKIAEDMAAAVVEHLGWDNIEAFEIGNEADLFPRAGWRNSSYAYEHFELEFLSYAKHVLNRVDSPRLKLFQGPVYSILHTPIAKGGLLRFIQVQHYVLHSVSIHFYPQSNCPGRQTSLQRLLSDRGSSEPAKQHAPFVEEARKLGLPYRLGEFNSVTCGGKENVSDVFGASLWMVDALFSFAAIGSDGVNVHGGPRGIYSPVNYLNKSVDEPLVKPSYYGMYFFARALGRDPRLVPVRVASSSDTKVKLWAVLDFDQSVVRVSVIHRRMGSSQRAAVVLQPSAYFNSTHALVWGFYGRIERMVAQSVFSKTGIYFGGLTFDGTTDGLPRGQALWEDTTQTEDGYFVLRIRPSTAALLTVPVRLVPTEELESATWGMPSDLADPIPSDDNAAGGEEGDTDGSELWSSQQEYGEDEEEEQNFYTPTPRPIRGHRSAHITSESDSGAMSVARYSTFFVSVFCIVVFIVISVL